MAAFAKLKTDYDKLMSFDFEKQSKENQLNTKILAYFLKDQIAGESYFYHNIST